MSNPILNDNFAADIPVMESDVMSVNGTIQKSFFMLAMLVASAAYTWILALQGFVDKANGLGVIGAIVAFIAVIAMTFSRGKLTPLFASVYSIGEGFFLGVNRRCVELSFGIRLMAPFWQCCKKYMQVTGSADMSVV